MKVIWSEYSRRIHRYDGDSSNEQCNVDSIRDDDRRTAEISDERSVHEWARDQKLQVCKRCL